MTWTQPLCDACFEQRYSGDVARIRADMRDVERCCYCGGPSVSGIYLRLDPATVPYPREEP